MIQRSWYFKWKSFSMRTSTGDTSPLCTWHLINTEFPCIARLYSQEQPHRQLGNWEDGPWFLSPLQRGSRLQFAAGRDSFQPTRCLWRAQWPARSGPEDERDTPSILTVALCDVFKARRVTTWLNRWGAGRDFFSAAFWNSCGRTRRWEWLETVLSCATPTSPHSSFKEDLLPFLSSQRPCFLSHCSIFDIFICVKSAVHVPQTHLMTGGRFPFTSRRLPCEPANIL